MRSCDPNMTDFETAGRPQASWNRGIAHQMPDFLPLMIEFGGCHLKRSHAGHLHLGRLRTGSCQAKIPRSEHLQSPCRCDVNQPIA